MSLEEFPQQDSLHCYLCDNTELCEKPCLKCNNFYCKICSSRLDPLYCDECLSDVVIEEKTYIKNTIDWDHLKDKLIEDRRHSKIITFRGIDWMFVSKRIADMSEEEVKTFIRYHQAHVSILESELSS